MAAAPPKARKSKSGKKKKNSQKNIDGNNRSGNLGGKAPVDDKSLDHKRQVIDTLTRKDRREFREAFQLFDKDDDGTITILELHEVFSGLNYHFTEEQLTQMINTIDDNGDGKIDLEEFILMMRGDAYNDPSNSKSYREELRDAFDVFDKDGNGSITVPELQATMEALGEHLQRDDIFAMIGEVDTDGDGNIDFPEFEKMMRQEHLLFDLERDDNKVTMKDLRKKGYVGSPENTDLEDDEKSD